MSSIITKLLAPFQSTYHHAHDDQDCNASKFRHHNTRSRSRPPLERAVTLPHYGLFIRTTTHHTPPIYAYCLVFVISLFYTGLQRKKRCPKAYWSIMRVYVELSTTTSELHVGDQGLTRARLLLPLHQFLQQHINS